MSAVNEWKRPAVIRPFILFSFRHVRLENKTSDISTSCYYRFSVIFDNAAALAPGGDINFKGALPPPPPLAPSSNPVRDIMKSIHFRGVHINSTTNISLFTPILYPFRRFKRAIFTALPNNPAARMKSALGTPTVQLHGGCIYTDHCNLG